MSKAVVMGLGVSLGRQHTHDLVCNMCRKVIGEGHSLVYLLCKDEQVKKGGTSREELEKQCECSCYCET